MQMIGSLIAAGGNLISGLVGASSAKKAAKQEYRQQKEFAQNGIQWKVQDAKAAGIHPLYALGANTASYAPVSVGNTNPLSGLAAAGQDLSRAVDVTRPASAKLDAFGKTQQALALERAGLENELLRSQIAKTRQESNPPMPTAGDRMLIEGQGNSPLVKTSPLERQSVSQGSPSQEAAAVAESGFLRTPTGWAVVQSKDSKDRTEEDTAATLAWGIRNRLFPSISAQSYNPPADVKLKPNEYWYFNVAKQEYQIRTRPTNWLQRPRGFGHRWEG